MASPLLDTSVFSNYKNQIETKFDAFHFSIVVFYELIASTIDEASLKKYQSWLTSLGKSNQLLMPTKSDWLNCAKSIRRLRHQKLIDGNLSATQLQNDALIARSACLHDCYVITENVKDFSLLQKVMPKLQVIPAEVFFPG